MSKETTNNEPAVLPPNWTPGDFWRELSELVDDGIVATVPAGLPREQWNEETTFRLIAPTNNHVN